MGWAKPCYDVWGKAGTWDAPLTAFGLTSSHPQTEAWRMLSDANDPENCNTGLGGPPSVHQGALWFQAFCAQYWPVGVLWGVHRVNSGFVFPN